MYQNPQVAIIGTAPAQDLRQQAQARVQGR
jgi:hypothetical protein